VKTLVMAVATLLMSSFAQAQTQSAQPPKAAQTAVNQAAPESGPAAPPGASSIDPAKEADIRQLLEAAGTKALMSEVMNNMVKSLRPTLVNSLPAGDYRAKLIDLFLDKFMARANSEFPKLVESAIPIYDKYLSDEDIKGLIQFYQTPLGQKTLSVLPMISLQMQSAGQKLGERIGRESMLQVLSEHPEIVKAMEAARTAPAH